MTNQKDLKLLKLLIKFKRIYSEHEENKPLFIKDTTQRIQRSTLRSIIGGTLELTDRHTITAWLNLIINNGAFKPTNNEFSMPTFNTFYYFNIETISFLINKLQTKINPPHTLLLDFKSTKDSFLSEENHGNGKDHQEINKTNNQQNKSLLSNLTQKEN